MFKSIANFRDIGGNVLPDGTCIRKGLLLRGGALHDISDEDSATLRNKYRVRHIFDFRTQTETLLAPDKPLEGADILWLPAIDEKTESIANSQLPKEAFLDLGPWLVKNSSNAFVQDVASRLYSDMVLNEYTQLQYAALCLKSSIRPTALFTGIAVKVKTVPGLPLHSCCLHWAPTGISY